MEVPPGAGWPVVGPQGVAGVAAVDHSPDQMVPQDHSSVRSRRNLPYWSSGELRLPSVPPGVANHS